MSNNDEDDGRSVGGKEELAVVVKVMVMVLVVAVVGKIVRGT